MQVALLTPVLSDTQSHYLIISTNNSHHPTPRKAPSKESNLLDVNLNVKKKSQ